MFSLAALVVLTASPDAGVITRLDLARTWEAAQLFHPAVMHREIDLDAAFITAVKALDVARTPEERRAAVGLVLAPLNDPSSRIVTAPTPTPPGPFTERDGGVVVLHAAAGKDDETIWSPGAGEGAIADATQVVVDLRGITAENPVLGFSVAPARDVVMPATQSIAHRGYNSLQWAVTSRASSSCQAPS